MPKGQQQPYPPEYRRKIVELARAGRPLHDLSQEFGVSSNSIRNWVKQHDLDDGRRSDGLTSEERRELTRLRRENKTLLMEREILKKAAVWFARETESTPRKLSDS